MGSDRPRGRRAGPTRREAVVAGAGLLLATTAGCRLRLEGAASQPAPPSAPPAPTPDDVARARLAATAADLEASAVALQRARPALRAPLAVVVADHRAHAAAARSRRTTSTGTGATASAAPSPAPVHPTVAALVAAERAAASQALTALPDVGPAMARLLASVAAALQVHVELLRPLR